MTLGEFLDKVEGLDRGTLLCVAEVDEAFGARIAQLEIAREAADRGPDAAEQEEVDLTGGSQTAIVLRW